MSVDREQAVALAAVIEACTCTTLRKASRVVTSLFDQAFEDTGLKSTQLSVIMAVAVHGPTTIRRLAELAVMDPSSLSRALPRLEEMGYISKTIGVSKRSRSVEITEAGLAMILQTGEMWEKAQVVFTEAIGSNDHPVLLDLLGRTISVGLRDSSLTEHQA
jgi:DNA-binding MarR family transcriptional regulator